MGSYDPWPMPLPNRHLQGCDGILPCHQHCDPGVAITYDLESTYGTEAAAVFTRRSRDGDSVRTTRYQNLAQALICSRSPILSLVIRLTVTHDSRKSYREYGADPTWNTVFVQNWEAVEYGSGLVCASIVHLKPLLRHLKPDSLGSAFTANRSRREQTYNNVPSYPLRARDSWHWNGPWDGTRHVRLVIREGRSDERTESPEGIITVTTELETREAARVGAVLPEYPKQAY